MRQILTVLLLVCSNLFFLFAQNREVEIDSLSVEQSALETEEIFEKVFENSLEDSEDENLVTYLEELLANKININKAKFSDLTKIPFLTAEEAKAIISYRIKYGNFQSEYEILNIPDLPTETARMLLPFIKISDETVQTTSANQFANFYKKTYLSARNRIQFDIQNRRGFEEKKYAGNKIKSYNRLIFKSLGNLQYGGLIEKDPGEKSYYDFYSFHFAAADVLYFNKIILGDYIVEHGHGLAVWSPYSFSKTGDAVNSLKPRNRGILPYTSADENKFLRGIAVQFPLTKYFELYGFYSNSSFDASVDTIYNEITSIPQDGYHRTESEIKRKNLGKEETFGFSLTNEIPNYYEISLFYMRNAIKPPLQKKSLAQTSGSIFNIYSFSYKAFFFPMSFIFGETSFDGDAFATLNGLQISASRNLIFATSIRYYSPKYNSLKAAAFGERSTANNEIGFYNGIRTRIKPLGFFNIFYDMFKFPYSSTNSIFPVKGNELYIDFFNNTFIKKISFNIRYKIKNKEIAKYENITKQTTNEIKQNYRFEISYEPFSFLRLRVRAELTEYQIKKTNVNENGYLIFHDLRYKPNDAFTLYFRYSIYQTDSYNARIYQFENDIPGVMTNTALYGKGNRIYVVGKFKVYKELSISFKYSETFKPLERTLSSGYSQINNNVDNKLAFQLDWKL